MSTNRQRGVTLVELVIFMIIVGVAAAGILGVLNISGRNSADPVLRKQALMIAESFMEEVQMARFTLCEPTDANAVNAVVVGDCATPVVISNKAAAVPPVILTRPFGNVAHYAIQEGVANSSFAVNGIDTDVNGRPLGRNGANNLVGNSSLAPMTTQVTLRVLPAADALGPAGNAITSTTNDLRVLRITVRTTYGNGFVELDGYRTRYAPTYLP